MLRLSLAAAATLQMAAAESYATLNVYSSTENPSVALNATIADELSTLLAKSPPACEFGPASRVGYTGFSIEGGGAWGTAAPGLSHTTVHTSPEAERLLLGLFLDDLPPQVVEHVEEMIKGEDVRCAEKKPSAEDVNGEVDCDATPVVGPDTPPAYDPDNDNGGCYETKQPCNNCYNYGTDVLTNTFAQPGYGSGKEWEENTCESVGAAAERDGLVSIGTELPTSQPDSGHHVALLIWPNTNFHWIRHDDDQYWSHKPGGSPVTNVDNSGGAITDPSASDFSPWTQFCGYYTVVPSEVTPDGDRDCY